MANETAIVDAEDLKKRAETLRRFLGVDKLQQQLSALEARMAGSDFWNNRERAADVEEVSRLKSLINPVRELEREIADFEALRQLAEEENNAQARAEAEREVSQEHERWHKAAEFELRQFLSGENDRANAFLTIHSGAGGTESCDWADMLLRVTNAGSSVTVSNPKQSIFKLAKKSELNRRHYWSRASMPMAI